MANVKITALEHLSSTQLAPEDVFVVDDVSVLITRKITTSNVTKYISNALGNAKIVENNLKSFASYANANAIALAASIANISTSFSVAGDSGSDVVVVGVETLTFRGDQGINTAIGTNELVVRLANTGVVSGTYGGSIGSITNVPVITVDSQGRVSNIQNTAIQVDFASVYSNISLVQNNVNTLAISVNSNTEAIEQRRASNTFYSYNTHSVVSYANIIPQVDNVQTLGTPSARWAEVYVGPGSVHIGSMYLSTLGTNSLKITDSTGAFTVIDTSTPNISQAITTVLSDVNNIETSIGNVANLATTNKSNLVAAINESISIRDFNSLSLGNYTFSEQITSNVSAVGAIIFSMPKNNQHFAKLLVNVEDLTYGQYQSSELLLVQDGNDSRLVEYGMVFTSTNPIASYETLLQGNNVVIRATALSSDNIIRVLKITT